jgi:hypothetical protein
MWVWTQLWPLRPSELGPLLWENTPTSGLYPTLNPKRRKKKKTLKKKNLNQPINSGFASSQTLAHVPIYSSIQGEIGNHARVGPSQSDGAGHVVRNPRCNLSHVSNHPKLSWYLSLTLNLKTKTHVSTTSATPSSPSYQGFLLVYFSLHQSQVESYSAGPFGSQAASQSASTKLPRSY